MLGSLIHLSTDGKDLRANVLFNTAQAGAMVLLDARRLYVGSRSGDAQVVDVVDRKVLKTYPTLAPVHDICAVEGVI